MIGRSLTRKQASRFRAGYASENRPFTVKYSQLKKTKQKSKQTKHRQKKKKKKKHTAHEQVQPEAAKSQEPGNHLLLDRR